MSNDYLFELYDLCMRSLESRLEHFKATGKVTEWYRLEVYPGTLLRRVRLISGPSRCVELVKVGRQTPQLRLFSDNDEVRMSLRNGDEILSMYYPDMRKGVGA